LASPVTTFDEVAAILDGIPDAQPPPAGRRLYDFVRMERPARLLELGFGHGTSTCYFAAALAANGEGTITTIDVGEALERTPSLDDLLDRTGLRSYVRPIVAERSYSWELMKLVEGASNRGRCVPQFDFCFVDGAHHWDTDALAFFLVEKLLTPGAWLLFDDLYWTFAASRTLRDTPAVRAMPDEERTAPHVAKVFELLVRQHERFDTCRTEGWWGWAHKRADG
jgi:predicted O-methyltransferase YrrM